MLELYIDADACPVKTEALRVAERHRMQVFIVSNAGVYRSRNPDVHAIIVPSDPDAADDWIAERAGQGDIVITADILLAQRCLKGGASVISPTGRPFTEDNIGSAIAARSLNAHLRELSSSVGSNPSFTAKDRSTFLQTLEESIQRIRRS